jgi:hypothetical protein
MTVEQLISNVDEIVKLIKQQVLQQLKCSEPEINPTAMNFIKTNYPNGWKKTIIVPGLGKTIVGFDNEMKSIHFINSKYISLTTIFGIMIKIVGKTEIEVSCFPNFSGTEISVTINKIEYSNNMSYILENDNNDTTKPQMGSILYPVTLKNYQKYNISNNKFNDIFKELGLLTITRDRRGNIKNGPGPRTLEELKSVSEHAKIDFVLNIPKTLSTINDEMMSILEK